MNPIEKFFFFDLHPFVEELPLLFTIPVYGRGNAEGKERWN